MVPHCPTRSGESRSIRSWIAARADRPKRVVLISLQRLQRTQAVRARTVGTARSRFSFLPRDLIGRPREPRPGCTTGRLPRPPATVASSSEARNPAGYVVAIGMELGTERPPQVGFFLQNDENGQPQPVGQRVARQSRAQEEYRLPQEYRHDAEQERIPGTGVPAIRYQDSRLRARDRGRVASQQARG